MENRSSQLSVIIWNGNALNSLINMTHLYTAYKRLTWGRRIHTHTQKGGKRYSMWRETKKKKVKTIDNQITQALKPRL